MNIVIVGATGNVGSRTMKYALEAGHQVIAYARRPESVSSADKVQVVKGDAQDPVALARAAKGADVRRIVMVSAFGAGDTADKAAWFMKFAYRTVLGKFFRDKAASDALLEQSGLDYTIVYPVNLKDAPASINAVAKPLEQVDKVPGMPTLPFTNVAQELVRIVADPASIGQRILLTTAKGWKAKR
ncbi:MAG: NAD(P)-binding oxidoreductase [Bifidobacterium psychraerophilum]|uniref:NAD(P)-dependent oxidoreductase n=1 Tax=Bifidobacterium psychraerophilum TaxID=218140 RepID=UPI0039ECC547